MDVAFKINIGEYEVLKSGIVITHLDKGVQFHIEGLTFNISFCKDENDEKARINADISETDNKCLNIKLVNYDDSIGRGLVFPVEVGALKDKKIYLQFDVSSFSNTETRTFAYTWLLK